jgi:hypothetical protein
MKSGTVQKIRTLIVMSIVIFTGASVFGQNKSGKPAFVIVDKTTKNILFIPNLDKFYQFKIYKKEKSEADYSLATTITRPVSPNITPTPYSLSWTDDAENTGDISYKIEAYTKSGSKICDMDVFWQCAQ